LFILKLINILFIQNINSILTGPLKDELFYEFGGIGIILMLCYQKLTKEN